MTVEEFNDYAKGHFPDFMGIQFVEVGDKWLRAEMEVKQEFIAPNGYLHAGTLVTLADTVAGFSCVQHLPEGAKSFTTIELKTNFLRTVREGTLVCQSEAEHIGRTTQIWRAIVKEKATGKKMAIFSCTQLVLY